MRSRITPRILISAFFLFTIIAVSIIGGRAFYEARNSATQNKLRASAKAENNSTALFAPSITATKTATLATDVNSNTFVNPGDTLMYSVQVSNIAAPGAGNDALNVVFTDQLNANLSLVGAAIASPIAVNDSYSVIGNVGITVPAGIGALVNDINPQGTGTISIVAGSGASANGGSFSILNDGSFSYNPPVGFQGTDTFNYTLMHSNGKTDTSGTVTLTISGMLWFVNNNAGACSASCDGRLSNPFTTLASFNAVNDGAAGHPGNNHTIFVYESATQYTGAVTLRTGQKFIGQDATATLASIAGVTTQSYTNALPAMNSGNGTITNIGSTITLNDNTTVRGLQINSTSSVGLNDPAAAITGVSVSEVSVTTTTATAVSLSSAGGTLSFGSISAGTAGGGPTNGISLNATTGSFTVNGDGGAANNGSGGTIQKTTGVGVLLNNVQSISLGYMNITNSGDDGINGVSVNGLTLTRCGITNNGNANSENGVDLSNASGNVTVSNTDVTNSFAHNFQIVNSTGTLASFTVTNGNFSTNTQAGNNGILFDFTNATATTASITGATFASNMGTGIQVLSNNGGNIQSFTMSGCTFNNNNIGADFSSVQSGNLTYNFNNNTIINTTRTATSGANSTSHAFNGFTGVPSTGNYNGRVENNTIGSNATAGSGSTIGNGIRINLNGSAVAKVLLSNNTIRQCPVGRGIEVQSNNPNVNATLTSNNVDHRNLGFFPGASDFPLAAIYVGAESSGALICADVRLNTVPTPAGSYDFPGFAGSSPWLYLNENVAGANINLLNTTAAVTAASQLASTNTGATGVNAGVALTNTLCSTPPFAPTIDPAEQPIAPQQGGSNSASLTTRLGQWLRPVFSAFVAPTNLSLKALGNWFSPSVSAAETNVANSTVIETLAKEPTINLKAAVPSRTMLVNSKGETRIVPTASLAAMAGELITVPTSGSFTLPAGKSTTIMFNATIGTGFTGTAITNQAMVAGGNFATALSNNLSTPVIQAPNFTFAFNPSTIATNTGISTATFTLVNPNPSQSLSGVIFQLTLAGGVQVAASPAASTSGCGAPSWNPAAAATNMTFSGGSIAAGGTCTVNVNVRGIQELNANFLTTQAVSTEANDSSPASAPLKVINTPTFTKAFGGSTVPLNGTTSLTFTITNGSAAFPLNGIGFTDSLPAGLIVDTPSGLSTTCNGSVGASPGGGSVTWSGGSLVATASCTISLNVKGTTVGAKNNSATLATTELGANSASTGTVTLNVFGPPTVTKSFSPSGIPLNGTSTLNITITNPASNPGGLSGISISDAFPAGIEVDATPMASNTCSGTFTANAAATSINLIGGSIASAGGSCTISVKVKGTTAGAKNNVTGTVSSTEGGTGLTANATLNVFAPPTITKSFSPTGVAVGGTSTLTLTITNPAGNPAGVSGVAVSDTFPPGMEVNTTPNAMNTCGGTFTANAMATSISLTGGSIASAGGSCSVSVTVKATTSGNKLNTTGTVSSTEGGTGLTASATLNVAQAPTVAKSFSPTSIALNGTSTLTLNFTNPNAFALNNLAISDAFPAGMEVAASPAATNTCGGVFAPAAGNTSISLAGGSLTSSGSCSISVAVKGTTPGAKNNTTGTVSTTESGTGGTSNTATLTVIAPPSMLKSFGSVVLISTATASGTTVTITTNSPHNFTNGQQVAIAGVRVLEYNGTFTITSVPTATTFTYTNPVSGLAASTGGATAPASSNVALNGLISMSIEIINTNSSSLSGIGFLDTLPAGITVPASFSTSFCGGTLNVTAPNSVSLSGASLAAGGGCIQAFLVRGAQAGSWQNTYTNVTSTESGPGPNSNTATLNVFAPPTIAKSFSPTGVQVGGTSTLTLTITNPATNPAGITGVAVSDTFPAGMEVNTTPNATNTCGGTFTANASATSISLTGGAIPTAGGSCSVSVTVKATTAGSKLNTTGQVSSTETGNGSTASATLTVAAAPTVSKSFSPTSIPVNGTSTMTISFTNPNAFALNGLAISDSFPAGVEVAASPAATNTCGGTFAPAAAATSISLSGGSLTSSGNCSITVAVKGTTAGAKNNVTGNVSTTESGAGGTANATLNVFAPPTIAKAFSPTSVALNGISTLTITITNPAANPAGVNGVAVSDTFPAGLVVDTTPSPTNTCGGTFSPVANAGSISLTGGAIASAGGSCAISVKVKGTTVGAKANTTGTVSSTEGGTGLTANATLNVFAAPTVTKAFSPTGVAINGTSTLTITITNPASNPAGITGVAISDTFPAGMEVNTTPGATNTCGGTFTAAAAATSINLTGGTIATAGGSCSISVVVKGTTAGVKNNTTGTVSSTEGGTGLTASATLTVAAAPTVSKSFSPTSIALNGTSTLTISFTNPNAFALNGLAISDSFPAGVEVAATPAATNTCGGTFAPAAAATSIILSGGSLTSSGSCSISVAVKGTTAGAKNNVTGNVSTTESGAGGTANATLNVFAPPTIAKGFSPTSVALNGISTLTITITNPAANPAGVNGVSVSDTFPAGLQVDTTPLATNTCGGTFSPVANATSISLSGGTIASAGGSCAISVKVKGVTAGAKANTTGAVSSTEGGSGLTASATLNVFAPPTVTKAFSPNSIQLNNTSTLTITITNPASNPAGITGVAISDTFPAGMEVNAAPGATNTCGGTFTAVAAATSVNLTGGAIATAGGSCSISVVVKGTTQGLKTNTTGAVSSTEGGAGLTATATLDVITCNSIVCPTDVFVGTTGNSAVVNYPAPSPNGICGTITCSPASGTSFNVGTTTVTCNSSIGNQSCSFNVTVNRVGGTATDPLACTGPGNTVQATLVITNNGNVNQNVADTTTFTNLVGVPNTCTISPNVGTCVVANGSLTYNATLTPGQTVTITYLTQVNDLALTGQQVCTNNSVTFNGGTPLAFSVCDVVDCPTQGPGNPFPARSEASDQGAGSVLIYNIYTSSASAPNTQNTKVSLTNTHPSLPSTVHLFFVDGTSCSIADSYVCLTANQTSSFLMSDIDPGTTGYLVAVATNGLGCPINFNFLVGDEYVKFQSGHAANLGAQAYSAIPGGLVACDQNSVTATINFDGVSYDRTGRTLALDSIGSKADGNDTMLVLNRIGGNLGTGAATLSTIFGIFYDDSENSLSFNVAGACQLRSSISNNFPRTTPRFETFIPAGRTGWMKFFSQSDIGITGAAINFNSNASASAGAFNQGHNLHVMTLTSAASYVIPVFPPSC